MRTTVDIPDETYRAIKVMAAEQGSTVRELILEGLGSVMRGGKVTRKKLEPHEVPAAQPLQSQIDRETNDDLVGFP
jgi:hypothetical protein